MEYATKGGRRKREKPFPGWYAEQASTEHSGRKQSLEVWYVTGESPGEIDKTQAAGLHPVNRWLMVVGADSMPTGIPNLGCGKET